MFEEGFGGERLAELREIRLPEPISYAPQTLGWWILFALLAIGLIAIAYRYARSWRRNAYRRRALSLLDGVALRLAGEPEAIRDVPVILKRVALDAWPRPAVATLSGERWLRFLDETQVGSTFPSEAGRALLDAAYAPRPPRDPAAGSLLQAARAWVRTHRVLRGRDASA